VLLYPQPREERDPVIQPSVLLSARTEENPEHPPCVHHPHWRFTSVVYRIRDGESRELGRLRPWRAAFCRKPTCAAAAPLIIGRTPDAGARKRKNFSLAPVARPFVASRSKHTRIDLSKPLDSMLIQARVRPRRSWAGRARYFPPPTCDSTKRTVAGPIVDKLLKTCRPTRSSPLERLDYPQHGRAVLTSGRLDCDVSCPPAIHKLSYANILRQSTVLAGRPENGWCRREFANFPILSALPKSARGRTAKWKNRIKLACRARRGGRQGRRYRCPRAEEGV
jgi:hypothetical protein